jgi:hypothetical protein
MNRLLIGSPNKTNFLLQFLAEDFASGVTIIDPVGDVARAAADIVPVKLTQKALYFDPSDVNHPVGLNVLQGVLEHDHQRLAEELCGYFDAMFPEGQSTLARANARYILATCLRLLLNMDGATLLGILKLLTDKSFRTKCLSKCTDPIVLTNAALLEHKQFEPAIALLQTKIGTLLMSPTIRNIVGQKTTTLKGATIIISNLDRSKLGDLTAKLLGGLLIARSTGQVYINDFPFFTLENFPFAQNRFTIALRFLDEVSRPLQQELLSIDDKVVMRTNPDDAKRLAFYVNVPNLSNIVDLDADQARVPYSDRPIKSDPPGRLKRLKAIQKRTRAVHTRPRTKVEKAIEEALQ